MYKLRIEGIEGIPAYVNEDNLSVVCSIMDNYFTREQWYFTKVDGRVETTPKPSCQWYKEISKLSGIVL